MIQPILIPLSAWSSDYIKPWLCFKKFAWLELLHHWLDGHEFEQALGVSDGQGSLACCSPWGHKESDTAERLNRTELNYCLSINDKQPSHQDPQLSSPFRSPGEGKRYPLQYSGLENSTDCIVHWVTKSQTQLSDSHVHFTYWMLIFHGSYIPI